MTWKVKELTELNETGRELYRNIGVLASKVSEDVQTQENIPSQLTTVRTKLLAFIKGVTRHQRTSATHVLVFMISSEDRRKAVCPTYSVYPIQRFVEQKMNIAGT